MNEWSQALSGHPVAGDSAAVQTISGNRGLQIEEKLLFEQDSLGHCGVDLPEPPAVRSRLGGLDRTLGGEVAGRGDQPDQLVAAVRHQRLRGRTAAS